MNPFNYVNVTLDSVEFQSIVGGFLEVISVSRPDGVSPSQWRDYWERFLNTDMKTSQYERGYKDGWDAAVDGD